MNETTNLPSGDDFTPEGRAEIEAIIGRVKVEGERTTRPPGKMPAFYRGWDAHANDEPVSLRRSNLWVAGWCSRAQAVEGKARKTTELTSAAAPGAITTRRRCVCCGAPATRKDAEGVPLCKGDYLHLMQHWRLDGFKIEEGNAIP